MSLPSLPTVPVHGLPIAQIDLSELFNYFLRAASQHGDGRPTTVAYVNANSCNLAAQEPTYRSALLDADLLYLDGNGPRLAAWMAGYWLPPRMTAADWFDDFCGLWADNGLTFYFLGSPPGIAAQAADNLRARYPELQIIGSRHGYLSPADRDRAAHEINDLRPDLLLLAMGSPTQEIWMRQLKDQLTVPIIWGAGGVLDYASGAVPRAPAWMCRLGLEWLGRMLIEPRRLAPRYAAGVPLFLIRSLRHALVQHARRLSF